MNYNHNPRKILITGKSGSGKTTFYLQELQAWKCRWKFIFDPDRETALKTGWSVSSQPGQLAWCIQNRKPVCFDPSLMFPGNRQAGFEFLCAWTVQIAAQLPGKKLFACDEVWRYVPARRRVAQSVQILWDEGRKMEIDLLLTAQRVNAVHDAMRPALTELVTFRHTDRLPLKWLSDYLDPEQVARLQYPGGRLRVSLI